MHAHLRFQVGTYILINLFVAIMVEGFATDPEAMRRFKEALLKTRLVFNTISDGSDGSSGAPPTKTSSDDKEGATPFESDSSNDIATLGRPTIVMTISTWLHRISRAGRVAPTTAVVSRDSKSLRLMSVFQRFCRRTVSHSWFKHVVMLFILLSSITLAMERPGIEPHNTERKVLDVFSFVITIVFTTEMLLKIGAMGFLCSRDSYLRSKWNLLDFFLVIVGWGTTILWLSSNRQASILRTLNVFRLFRALRPLRLVQRLPRLRQTVETLFISIRPLSTVFAIGLVFYLVFAILGVSQSGKEELCTTLAVRRNSFACAF